MKAKTRNIIGGLLIAAAIGVPGYIFRNGINSWFCKNVHNFCACKPSKKVYSFYEKGAASDTSLLAKKLPVLDSFEIASTVPKAKQKQKTDIRVVSQEENKDTSKIPKSEISTKAPTSSDAVPIPETSIESVVQTPNISQERMQEIMDSLKNDIISKLPATQATVTIKKRVTVLIPDKTPRSNKPFRNK